MSCAGQQVKTQEIKDHWRPRCLHEGDVSPEYLGRVVAAKLLPATVASHGCIPAAVLAALTTFRLPLA